VGELRWTSASEQARLLARGEVSGAELRDAAVAACEGLDPGLGFLVAPLADRAPPGIPMLLKDAGQELAGTPHHVGVAALRDAGHRSRATTELAARFEAAGFSIVGKAACPPLANGVTTEPPGFAPTRNPWDRSRSAGGSSGGSAAAVACGAVPIAHGSDATGSLRCPAALCGLVTLVPTAGRIPGVPPFAVVSDATRPSVLAWVSERLGRPVRPGELDAAVFEAADRAAGRTRADVEAAQRAIDEVLVPLTAWWDAHDLLVTPATFQPAWPLGGRPGPRELGTLAAPFSLTGQPALAVPMPVPAGAGAGVGAGGLPVGVQIVGRRGADEALLDLAAELQAAEDWTATRPPSG
jgi:Asp-tRNA(Asn)/Glu-tRNA(Gln) amidotransferase A subunit family amidase